MVILGVNDFNDRSVLLQSKSRKWLILLSSPNSPSPLLLLILPTRAPELKELYLYPADCF